MTQNKSKLKRKVLLNPVFSQSCVLLQDPLLLTEIEDEFSSNILPLPFSSPISSSADVLRRCVGWKVALRSISTITRSSATSYNGCIECKSPLFLSSES